MESSTPPTRIDEVAISFSLPVEDERRLIARAVERGTDVATYLRGLVEEDLKRPPKLGEILAPIREDFRRSGMAEDELEGLIEEARDEVWREKQRGKSAR